ncbi:MAG: T9SS type A sorting domain-containing protein, partial [Bacteroidales bacterium]|nr:T9SS type A sorting domain-containing protein [Bacteroidales bacterium]
SFSNWCPGDVIDNRIIKLGALQAGEYKFTIEVPDAVFRNGEGYFPLSLYFQGKTSGVIAGRYTIKGKVIYNNNPLSGVTFDGSLALTNPAGEYTVFADSNATITLTPKLSGYSFTPSSITCSNISDNLIDKNFIAETLGIEDMRSDKFSINIYPNPITTEIHVKLDSPEISDYAIYNFSGQIVLQGRVRNASTINVEALAKGVYYLRISNTVFKVIKN